MEAFSALLTLCEGNSSVTVEFPAQRPLGGALMFSLICAWAHGWENHWDSGDSGRHRAHYDVNVMGLLNANIVGQTAVNTRIAFGQKNIRYETESKMAAFEN